MMNIAEETISSVLETADIVNIATEAGLDVKKQGKDYKCLCPFHDDKHPSLTLYRSTNQYHCFACGSHGNSIQLYMHLSNKGFRDAINTLGKRYDLDIAIDISTVDEEKQKRLESYRICMRSVSDFYFSEFQKSEKAQEYAYGRWGEGFCQLARIGYAPPGGNHLANVPGLNMDILRELGLCNEYGYDFYQDRLMINISDRWGNPIAFTARAFGDGKPKYLNNKDSEIFHKKDCLFGVENAWVPTRKTGVVYLVEGAPDVLRLQSLGVMNAVACLGSSWVDEHWKNLRQMGAKKLIFIPDSDELKEGDKHPQGISVVLKAGKEAISKYFNVAVKEIPASPDGTKRDADSYFLDLKTFEDTPEEDFVLWLAEKTFYEVTDIDETSIAIKEVAQILARESDSVKEDMLIDELKGYAKKSAWKAAIKGLRKGQPSNQGGDPTTALYGFREENGYYVFKDEDHYTIWSNFTMTPLFHILDPISPRRIFLIRNRNGEEKLMEMRQEDLVSLEKFRLKIEGLGNYIWWVGSTELQKLKSYLYEKTDTATPIPQLGWQLQGFFAFGNGIFSDGEFEEPDEYGIVRLSDGNYYLPSSSSIYKNEGKFYKFERSFTFREGTVTLKAYTDCLFSVFGENGDMGFAFLLSSAYHDIIYDALGWFPLANFFGPIGSGKTALAKFLANIFFTEVTPPNLDNSTIPALADLVGAAANVLIVLDEYKNSLETGKIEFLKGLWDGVGRTRLNWEADKRKETTPVNSGVIICGQEMPTKDSALFSRTIFLQFPRSQFSDAETTTFNALTQLATLGLTHLSVELLKYREKVKEEFTATFQQISDNLEKSVADIPRTERIHKNWAVPVAVYKIIGDSLGISLPFEKLLKFAEEGVRRQNLAAKSNDEIGSFWNVFQYLFSQRQIFADGDFKVEFQEKLTCLGGEVKTWDEGKNLIFLPKKSRIFEMYQETCRKIGNSFIPRESLAFYLEHCPAYIGEANHRYTEMNQGIPIPDKTRPDGHGGYRGYLQYLSRSYVFDYEQIVGTYGIDLVRAHVVDEDAPY